MIGGRRDGLVEDEIGERSNPARRPKSTSMLIVCGELVLGESPCDRELVGGSQLASALDNRLRGFENTEEARRPRVPGKKPL